MPKGSGIEVRPVTPDRWDDLAALFGIRGGYGHCWCMWWRVTSAEFEGGIRERGRGNRRRMRTLVRDGAEPGLLAYRDGRPVGWVSVAPRDQFGRIERSRVLGPVDDRPVWSIVCFFIGRAHRASGVGTALLEAAVRHAADRGATEVEAYPVDPAARVYSNADAYTGLLPMFLRAGFREVERRSAARPIVRKRIRRRARRARSG
ncbi:MAG TPA: GNAT family N-acetyltransferase [Actinomycetota bacterium]|nr:GNAT family N-acetyltransferase [Actinomycetota bacterium]